MTKISTYVVDEKVTALDKWIGSDANMQNRTKNFTPKKLAAYFNEDQVINIGTPLQYKYYTLDPLEARPDGTLTFETEIGPTVNFSSITTFLLSKYTTKQNIVSDFLNFLDGSKVLLFKSSDINSFGFYRISSLEPYEPDPNFFVVTVEYETGNGALEEDEDYMISLVSLAGGSIPTKTSQLINDGDDGVNPFISELDIDRTEWDAAYEGKINSADVTGTTTKTLTLTKQDGSTIEASWTDSDTGLTSVGVSMPSAFSVTNSPLTSNGTITITGAGTSLEYVRGDGTLGTFPTLTGYVPYTGANQSVDLGTNLLSSGRIHIEGTDANTGSYLGFRQHLSVTTSSEGYTSLYAFGSQSLQFLFNQGGTDNKKFTFNVGSITSNVTGGRVYSMPDADGTLALTSNLSSYVPYTGATGDVNLGVHQLKADSLAVSTTSTETVDVGEIVWNAIDGTFDMGLIRGVTLQAGQELHIYGKATEVISNGQAVMFAGVQGDHILISKADAATINSNPEYLIGVATQDFATNDFGYVTVFGNVRGLDTTAYTLGSVLYYDSTTATDGSLTATMPTAPNAKIEVAAVVRVHATQGILLVRPHVMPKLKDIQDVYAPSPSSNNGLFWNSSTLRYENNSIIGALGYTPYNATNPSNYITLGSISSTATGLTYTNTTGVFSLTSGYVIPTTIQESNWNDAYSNRITSASSPLSISSNAISISQAGTSTNGYLTSSDWNLFNDKQVAGNYITSLTGEATASGPGAASVTLNNASVTAKILSGVNITGGTILDTDTMLTAFGKLQNQINSLIGGSIYQGVWNASTNTPTLTSSVGTDGNYYIVNVAGSTDLNGITDWKVGDWAIFHGGTWQKVDNTDAVSSVNGFTGAVSLTTSNIPEGPTNFYYTDARVSANTDVAANTFSRHSPVLVDTIGSINGLYIGTNQLLTLTTATPTQNGALSSNDWNTFNNKQDALSGTGFVKISGTTISYDNNTYALDSSVVHLTGTETITGSKIFNLAPYLEQNLYLKQISGWSNPSGYTVVGGRTDGLLLSATSSKTAYIGLGNLTQAQTFDFPNVSGTLALTSQIPTVSGTTNYLPKFTGATSLGDSLIYDNGTNVFVGGSGSNGNRFTVVEGGTTLVGQQILMQNASSANDALNIVHSGTGKLIKGTKGVEVFNITNSGGAYFAGNVGIGTTNPLAILTTANTGNLTLNSNDGDHTGFGLYIQAPSTTNSISSAIGFGVAQRKLAAIAMQSYADADQAGLNFYVQPTATGSVATLTEAMRITSSGTVGIGVVPKTWYTGRTALQIGTRTALYDTNGAAILGYNIYSPSNNNYILSLPAMRYIMNDSGHTWQTAPSGTADGVITFTDRMTITSGGRVGIGTSTPSTNLHVVNSENANWTTTFLNTASGGHSIYTGYNNTTTTIRYGLYITDGGNDIYSYDLQVGSGKFLVRGDGNVGIGTTSPSAKLEVKGLAKILNLLTTDARGGGDCYLSFSDPTGEKGYVGYGSSITDDYFVANNLNSNILFRNNGAERMRITSAGNVGIGNVAPQTLTHLYTSTGQNIPALGSAGGHLTIQTGGVIATVMGVNTNGNFYIQPQRINAGGSNVYNTLLNPSGGNVGIGTDSPAAKLDIYNNTAFSLASLVTASDSRVAFRIKGRNTATNTLAVSSNNTTDYILQVVNSDGTSSGNILLNSYGGNVGIGTTDATDRLTVVGPSGGIAVKWTDNLNNTGYLRIRSSAAAVGADNNLLLETAGVERVRVNATGQVGLGIIPTYQLQLSTNSAAKPSTNTWTIASDSRIKTDVQPYTKGLSEILNIRPVTYKYNGLGGFNPEEGGIGIIAQEIKEVLPETVNSYMIKLNEEDEEETEIYNFDSHAITFVLINAIQEQQKQIEELKKLINK